MSLGGLFSWVAPVLGLFGAKKAKPAEYSTNYSSSILSQVPEAPQPAPESPDGLKTAAVLAAEEEEKRKRAAAAAENKTNYTSGLGVTGSANIQRKQLLG
jgi:hypothetical protein